MAVTLRAERNRPLTHSEVDENFRLLRETVVNSTSTPFLAWEGASILWLGTSIPHQGAGVNGYPELVAEMLMATVDNNAWSGSTASFDKSANPFTIQTVKCLSMTEDDRVALLAQYGSSSAYDDSFEAVTKASQMTADFRIKSPFASTPFDVVVLDHNHNDRRKEDGTLSPASVSMTGITKGVTTSITIASNTIGLAVGDGIRVRVSGIGSMDYWAGRVQSVAGTTITINLDTSGYSGTFTSGTVYKVDRSTWLGALDFLISYIKWCGIVNGKSDVKIILSSAPSQYTGDDFDEDILPNGRLAAQAAQTWGVAYFDICQEMGVTADQHLIMFPDTVHPTTLVARNALASCWARMMTGKSVPTVPDTRFLPSAVDAAPFTAQREAEYNAYFEGFTTPEFFVGSMSTVLNEDFTAGLGSYTIPGDTPTTPAAPWGAGDTALYCDHSGGATDCYVSRTGLTLDKSWEAEFDLWLPVVSGITSVSPATVQVLQVRSASGAYVAMQLIVTTTGTAARLQYFDDPGTGLNTVQGTMSLSASTRYTVKIESVRADASYSGAIMMSINGTRVTDPIATADDGQPTPDRINFGAIESNTGQAFDIYLGNLVLRKAAVSDYTGRISETITTLNGRSLTLVNGKAVSVAATGAVTVANLPTAATAGVGARSFVSDANATTFASIVAGGGANNVPVYSDGTNWRIG